MTDSNLLAAPTVPTTAAILAGQFNFDDSRENQRLYIGRSETTDYKTGRTLPADLPWGRLLKEDMAHFRKMTTQRADPSKINAVVMGYKTWKSLPAKIRVMGAPRLTIVVVNRMPTDDDITMAVQAKGWLRFCDPSDLAGADPKDRLAELREFLSRKMPHEDAAAHAAIETVYFAGGAWLYEHAVNVLKVSKIYVTQVEAWVVRDGADEPYIFEADVSVSAKIFDRYAAMMDNLGSHTTVDPQSGAQVSYTMCEYRRLLEE